jgi:sulfoxide reductase heme-binding subunit YedZ
MPYLKKHWLLILMHVLALLPLALLAWDFLQNQLTVNPIQEITHRTGYYALLLLVLSLACTPLNTILGLRQVVPLRRWLGLYAFLYASLHFLTYIGLDYGLNLGLIWQELAEKRYVVAGFAAFVLLIPLALTSTRGWMRRLGKNWKRLHRLVYVAAILAVMHFVWLVKSDITEPLLFGAVLALLLLLRVPAVRKKLIALRYRIAPPRRTGA